MADPFRLLAAALTEVLRPHGFRAAGLRWRNVTVPAVVRDLSVEKFRFNAPGLLRFRLVLSFYLATGAEGEFGFPRLAGRYTLALQTNDAALRGEDGIFRLLPDPVAAGFLSDLQREVAVSLLPRLEAATSVEAVEGLAAEAERRVGAGRHAAVLAIALARLGRTEAARAQFRRSPGEPGALRAMAARYGIDLDA
jgi:hypothetical protein